RTFKYKSTVYIPKPSRNPKGQKWTTFTPPATTLCRRYRGRVLLRRSHLHNEARCLHGIAHREVMIGEQSFLVPYIEGHLLVAETLDEAALHACLEPVHEAGYTFCDLRPSNVIVAAGQCYLIDWEFCTRTGTIIESMPSRPYSSGFTHPDLIWAKGVVDPRLDHFSMVRLQELLS
ncbi:hypothetical protein, partial [Donghicola sp. XS_ASV15]|uniref:hypothetical protein n=1 Tax=Donghicola sp. XS_ASV15 TaxID=3241295 RepID=UPI0035112C5B